MLEAYRNGHQEMMELLLKNNASGNISHDGKLLWLVHLNIHTCKYQLRKTKTLFFMWWDSVFIIIILTKQNKETQLVKATRICFSQLHVTACFLLPTAMMPHYTYGVSLYSWCLTVLMYLWCFNILMAYHYIHYILRPFVGPAILRNDIEPCREMHIAQ